MVAVVHLADHARPLAHPEQQLLDLVLDDLAALFDDEDLFEPAREFLHAFGLQRPRHADLVQPQADPGGDLLVDAELAQCLAHVLVALA